MTDKLLFYGDSPHGPTGFGRVSEGIFRELSADWDIQIFALNHQDAFPVKDGLKEVNIQNATKLYPEIQATDPYKQQKFLHHLQATEFDYDRLLLLHDSFVLSHQLDGPAGGDKPFVHHVVELARQNQARVVLYFPVDSPPPANWVQPLTVADKMVVYTDWARKVVGEKLKDTSNLEVIPHGTYTDTFHPLPESQVNQLRQNLQIPPNSLALGYVGVNHLRKNIPRDVMLAFAEFHSRYPQTNLLLKTQPVVQENGWDLVRVKDQLTAEYGLEEDAIKFVTVNGSAYLPDELLNQLYNALDALYLPSMEGWGLPVTEAFSTKTPTLVGDHAGLSDVGADGRSLKINVPDDPNFRIGWGRDMAVFRSLIDIHDFVKTAGKLIEMSSEEKEELTDRAYTWIQDHTWNIIASRWNKLLSDL